MTPQMLVAAVLGVFACVLAATWLVSSLNSRSVTDVSNRPTGNAVAAKPVENKAAAKVESTEIPQPSRVVGAVHQNEGSCDDQTWPYIDQRCLTIAPPKDPNPPAKTPSGIGAKSSSVSFSRSTDGKASAADRVTPAAEVNTALPDRPMAVTGDPVLKPAEPVQEVSAKTEPAKPELALPARNAWAKATPADRATAPTAQTSEPTMSPRRKARMQRERTARLRGDPNRIVRRWREVEYQSLGGDTRKIIYVRPGTLQRDSYFETAR